MTFKSCLQEERGLFYQRNLLTGAAYFEDFGVFYHVEIWNALKRTIMCLTNMKQMTKKSTNYRKQS